MKEKLLLLVSAAAGGVAGFFLFFWIVRQGFYGIILPGCLVGFGAGFFPSRSVGLCVLCGVMALAFGLFAEWRSGKTQKCAAGQGNLVRLFHTHRRAG